MSQLLLAGVVAAAKRVGGRVKLQKMVYLLQEMGFDLGYRDFVLLLYGPYSDTLAAHLDRVTGEILNESQEPTGYNVPTTGEPTKRYVYEPRTPELKDTLLGVLCDRFEGRNDDLQQRITELNESPAPVLELAATAVYGRSERGLVEPEQLWEWVLSIKNHLESRVPEAKQLLAEWDEQEAFQS